MLDLLNLVLKFQVRLITYSSTKKGSHFTYKYYMRLKMLTSDTSFTPDHYVTQEKKVQNIGHLNGGGKHFERNFVALGQAQLAGIL